VKEDSYAIRERGAADHALASVTILDIVLIARSEYALKGSDEVHSQMEGIVSPYLILQMRDHLTC
jgi:hypothetical protein